MIITMFIVIINYYKYLPFFTNKGNNLKGKETIYLKPTIFVMHNARFIRQIN